MNDFIRLTLDAGPKSIPSPLEIVPDIVEADQFALRFLNAVVIAHNDMSTAPSLNATDIDNGNAERLEIVPDTQSKFEHQTANLDPFTAPKTDRQVFELAELIPEEQRDISEETKSQIDVIQRSRPLSDAEQEEDAFLQDYDVLISFDVAPRSIPVFAEFPLSKQSSTLMKVALPSSENETVKSAPKFFGVDLTDDMNEISELKNRATKNRFGSSSRSVSKMILAPSLTPSAAEISIPTAPTTWSSVSSSGGIRTHSIPVLNVEIADQWIEKLSHDIRALSTDKSTLSFQLKPHHLGKLHVAIATDVTGEIVRLETDNENAKALILASQGRLEQDIRLTGMKLARLDVSMQDQFGSHLEQQGSGFGSSNAPSEKNRDGQIRKSTGQISASQKQNVPDVPLHGARYA